MNLYAFRPFRKTDKDYETVTDIWNTIWPDTKQSPTELRGQDNQRLPTRYYQRVIAEKAGTAVGFGTYCETWWYNIPGRYYLSFHTLPEQRHQGIASAFFDNTLATLRRRETVSSLESFTRENQKEGVRFLEKQGFNLAARYPRSRLDVSSFASDKYADAGARIAASGIQLLTPPQLAEFDPEWQRHLWLMECEIDKDIPAPDPIQSGPLEEYVRLFERPDYCADTFIVAVDDGNYVGTSTLWRSEADTDVLYTGLTGVLRSHRRRGLATAMKSKTIGIARQQGYRFIEADNEENNPMYQLNMTLGFKPQPAELEYHKKFDKE